MAPKIPIKKQTARSKARAEVPELPARLRDNKIVVRFTVEFDSLDDYIEAVPQLIEQGRSYGEVTEAEADFTDVTTVDIKTI